MKYRQVLAALGEPTRLHVVDVLRLGPMAAGDLAEATGTSPAALSRHLRVLRASGIVEVDAVAHDARVRIYRLRQQPFTALQSWLDQVQAFWDDQLRAFKAHAERRP